MCPIMVLFVRLFCERIALSVGALFFKGIAVLLVYLWFCPINVIKQCFKGKCATLDCLKVKSHCSLLSNNYLLSNAFQVNLKTLPRSQLRVKYE